MDKVSYVPVLSVEVSGYRGGGMYGSGSEAADISYRRMRMVMTDSKLAALLLAEGRPGFSRGRGCQM